VKVADFGVARVQAQSGVMTAETGTYRWMAPEVKCILYFPWFFGFDSNQKYGEFLILMEIYT